jgi:DNA-binding NtrC family response regulator
MSPFSLTSSTSPDRSSSPLASGHDVLVVEDDPRVRRMLAQALKEMNFSATFAASAEAAAPLIAERTFDTLIVDLNLPGIGGMEFVESVRRRRNDVPIIILTGFGDLDAARKAIHLDVVEFLTKPCTLGTLETAMSRARQRRRGQIVTEAAASPDPALRLEPARRPAFAEESSGAPATDASTAAEGPMEEVERRHIFSVLRKHNGNRAATAAELGISVRKLYYRLGEYQRKGLGPSDD